MSHFMGMQDELFFHSLFYMLSDLSDACVDLSIALQKWESTIVEERELKISSDKTPGHGAQENEKKRGA